MNIRILNRTGEALGSHHVASWVSNPQLFSQVDAPARFVDFLHQFVERLSTSTFLIVLPLAILLIVCTTQCGPTLQRFAPTMQRGALIALQAGCCLLGLFVSLAVPIGFFHYTSLSKAFLFYVAIFAVVVLPCRLAYALTPKQGNQAALAVVDDDLKI